MGPLTRAALFYDFAPAALEPSAIDWDAELPRIVNQRLAAVAQRMIQDLGLRPPGPVAGKLQGAVFDWTQASCIASGRAAIDLDVLREHQLEFVVTKGPGIACHARRLAERPYTDIDIFVAEECFFAVLDLLGRSGYGEEDKNLVPWPGLGNICREAVNLRTPAGGSIDIHHRIPPWFWGSGVTFSDVLARSRLQSVPGGGSLPCASAVDNLLISALHIVSDKNIPGATLMAWRDFLLLAYASDADDVLLRSQQTRLCGWIKWVMSALPSDALPAPLVEAFADEDPGIPGHGRLTVVMSPGIASRRSVLSQAFRLPTTNAVKYLGGLVWPSTAFLHSRVGDAPHPRINWWRKVLSGGADLSS
jgi:hypothetical protein